MFFVRTSPSLAAVFFVCDEVAGHGIPYFLLIVLVTVIAILLLCLC